MALRLAGEPFLTIQGADSQGWVREITAQDTLPGLKIDQQGAGRIFDFQDGGVSKMYLPNGGNVTIVGSLDVNTIAPGTGDLTLNPAGIVDATGPIVFAAQSLRSRANTDFWIIGNKVDTEAIARKIVFLTIDPVADAQVKAAEVVPTATVTTPMLTIRGNIPVPTTSSTQGLLANFLTFRWNPANDQVSVYVNDGGTIRSAVIGTVA